MWVVQLGGMGSDYIVSAPLRSPLDFIFMSLDVDFFWCANERRVSSSPTPQPGLKISVYQGAGGVLSHILKLFCSYTNPHQVEEFNCILPTSTWTTEQLEPEG